MQHKYSVSEFYMLLKLGIWQTGTVNFWGQVDIIPAENRFFYFGDLNSQYNASSLIRKHLDHGVYLLDLFYTGRDVARNIKYYQLIVAVCRHDMTHLETLYTIQVSNTIPAEEFFEALRRQPFLDRFRERGSFFSYSRRGRNSLSGNIPIGSRFIHHR